MCDYSLCGLPTRLAQEGDDLVVHRFRSGSLGLIAAADLRARPVETRGLTFWGRIKRIFEEPRVQPATVVCMPPGAQLTLRNIPEDLQRRWNIGEEETAVFMQTSADANRYRDAVRFREGPPVLLQCLREGVMVRVVSLGGAYAETEPDLAEHFV